MELELTHREMKHKAAHLIKSKLDSIVQLESKIRTAEQEQLVASLEQAVIAHFASQKVRGVLRDESFGMVYYVICSLLVRLQKVRGVFVR